ncbi:SDR family oxidoreductase [Candidatus Bathyarchaeota archaeon]|nr:SDR family oxidoreductase [Candidatus Bathyarchaeota archaeon]
MDFKDKVVLVTGGASGIGKETALQFASHGANVAIFDIDQEEIEKTHEELKAQGGEAIAVVGDVRKSENVEACVGKVVERFGPPDFLINCAGILKDALIHRMPDEMFEDVINVNLKGVFFSIRECAKIWVKEPYGKIKQAKKAGDPIPPPTEFPDRRIINIASMAAEGNIGQVAYSASKAGVIGITKTAAKELIKYNIKTHAIMPTLIDTPIIGDLLVKDDGKWRKFYEGRIPLGIGKPRYVADAILFLCSDESFFMNGNVMHLNGGKLGDL